MLGLLFLILCIIFLRRRAAIKKITSVSYPHALPVTFSKWKNLALRANATLLWPTGGAFIALSTMAYLDFAKNQFNVSGIIAVAFLWSLSLIVYVILSIKADKAKKILTTENLERTPSPVEEVIPFDKWKCRCGQINAISDTSCANCRRVQNAII